MGIKQFILVTVLVTGCGEGFSQSEPTICDSCTVELRPVVMLDFTDTPFLPSQFVNVEQLSDGTFVVADWARGDAEILHFDPGGSYIDSHLREGTGPGDAMGVQATLAIGDSLLVMDHRLARCTILDADFEYVRNFQCFGLPLDAAQVNDKLFLTGFGAMELVEVDLVTGDRELSRWEGVHVPISDDYASIAAGADGVWFVPRPNEYRLTYWRPGEKRPSRVIERKPKWWREGEPFLMDRWPSGAPIPPDTGQKRQVMRGPLLYNIAVADGFIWTASYRYTRKNKQYAHFLDDWLEQGLQGDVEVFVEALTPHGELVASVSFDNLAPPRFTAGGFMYALNKEGHWTGVTLYRPKVVPSSQASGTTSMMPFGIAMRDNPVRLVAPIRELVRSIDREVPVSEVLTMQEVVDQAMARPRFNLVLLGTFAAAALILAGIGIYSVISYAVSRRAHEIGIRVSLGARRGQVVRMIVKSGMTLAVAGAVVGLTASLALSHLMSSLPYSPKAVIGRS